MTRTTIGIDIGGTSAKVGLLLPDLTVREADAIPTGKDLPPQALADAARDRLEALQRTANDLGHEIAAVGVGSAGLVNVEDGIVHTSPNLPTWKDVPLREVFSETLKLPVSLINDANAFAYAEGVYGAGAGCRAGLFVTLGTGVGGALLIDGEFLGGAYGTAGEIGHMSVDVNGEECPCGGRGCLELLVGARPIVERAKRMIASGAPGAAIYKAAGGEDAPITPRVIAEAARAGDWTATKVYADMGEILGTALSGVANLLSLDVIVVGGGVAETGEPLWKPMRDWLAKRSMSPEPMKPRIVAPRFAPLSGVVGAAAYARDHTDA